MKTKRSVRVVRDGLSVSVGKACKSWLEKKGVAAPKRDIQFRFKRKPTNEQI